MSEEFILFIHENITKKTELKWIDLGTGDGTFLFDLIDGGKYTFAKLQGIDNGKYENQLGTNFEEDFNDMLLSHNYFEVIPEFIPGDEFNFMKSVGYKYHIITAQNFLHFFDWSAICNSIELLLAKLEVNGNLFISVANVDHTGQHIKYKFSHENIKDFEMKFNIVWKKERKHYYVCFKKTDSKN